MNLSLVGLTYRQLSTQLETSPYAFWVAAGGATFLTCLIFMAGMRILRRVRRVALSDHGARSLRQVMAERMWNKRAGQTAAAVTRIDTPRPRSSKSMFLRIFRRQTPRPLDHHQQPWGLSGLTTSSGSGSLERLDDEPVWINKEADDARARDAARHQEMAARAKAEWEERFGHLRGSGYSALEEAWRETENCWGEKELSRRGWTRSRWTKE